MLESHASQAEVELAPEAVPELEAA
jgi:hypothetical protein